MIGFYCWAHLSCQGFQIIRAITYTSKLWFQHSRNSTII